MRGRAKPTFIHHDDYFKGMECLFRFIQAPPDTQTAVASSLLVKNGVVLLHGTYGTGKTQLVNLIKRIFFSDGEGGFDYDYETCHQELTAFDVLYHLDLAELEKGREIVHPKKMITARLKFLNEIQRANPALYNSLLPLLSEREVTYRDMVFKSPDFVLIMDQNPQDEASSEIPRAFFDRIDYMINLATIDLQSSIDLFNTRSLKYGIEWDSLEKLSKEMMTADQIEEVWFDVIRVKVNVRELYLANFLVNSFSACIKGNRSITNKSFFLDCESCKFKGEICFHVLDVPGQRALNSMIKMSQSRAWLAKRDQISFEDLLFSLPYSLSHRLVIKREELMIYENSFEWIKKKAIEEVLNNKFDSWKRAINQHLKGKSKALDKIAREDLVVRQLENMT